MSRAPRSPATRFRQLTVAVVALAVAFAVITVLTRGDEGGWNTADNLGQAVVSFVAALGCVSAARRHDGRARMVWAVLAAGCGLWCVGQLHWSWWEITRDDPPPSPS